MTKNKINKEVTKYMTNYKAWRMPGIGEKPRWVIIDETEKTVNKNPTKDELRELKIFLKEKRDNKYSSSLCDICNRPFEEAGHGTHYKEKIEQQWTGRYICHKCYMKVQNDKPDSYNNLKKQISNRRTGNLRPDSEQILGDMFQCWTCVCFGVGDMNLVKNDHNSRVDHDIHPKYGTLETLGRKLNVKKNVYSISWGMENKKMQPFDNLIFWCTDTKYELETGYIFPKEVLMDRNSISITRGCMSGWYEKFRISELIIENYKIIIKDNYLIHDEFIKNRCRK